SGTARAGEVALHRNAVRLYSHELLAVFDAEVQAQPFVRGRQLDTGAGQVGGQVCVIYPLLRRAFDQVWRFHVTDRCRVHGAGAPDVPRHATGGVVLPRIVRRADHVLLAIRTYNRVAGLVDLQLRIERILDVGLQQVGRRDVVAQGDTFLRVNVVRHVVVELSLAAEHEAPGGVAGVGHTIATLDVAAAEERLHRLRVAEGVGGAQTPDGGALLGGHERVVAVEGVLTVRLARGRVDADAGADECGARGNLRQRVIVQEHDRAVDLVVVVDVVVGEGARVPALVRAHVVIERAEVVGVLRGRVWDECAGGRVDRQGRGEGNRYRCQRISGRGRLEIVIEEPAGRIAAGAAALRITLSRNRDVLGSRQRTQAEVARGLGHRGSSAIADVSHRVPLPVGKIAAEDHGDVLGGAIPHRARRRAVIV